MYSIPLRRALVTQSDLPYPEGVACAEVLKVGGGAHGSGIEESRAGLSALVWGSIVSAAFSVVTATQLFAGDVVRTFRVGSGVTLFDLFLSLALFGVGHLVGLWVGVAMVVGALIGWIWGVPHYAALAPDIGSVTDATMAAFSLTTWATRCASSARARSGSRPSGPWSSWCARWLRACARPWPPRARARPGRPHCCRAPSRTCRSGSSA